MIYIPEQVGATKSITASLGIIYEVYEKSLLDENNKKIYLYGDFILNDEVKKEFNNLGMNTIYDVRNVTNDDIVILNSYGVSKEIYDYLDNNEIEYYDCTNKSILKLEKEIKEKYEDNYEIILVGNQDDYELNNLNSYCNNEGIIIDSADEFVKLSNNSKKYIVCTTNYNKDDFKNICKVIENNYDCVLEKFELRNELDLIVKESSRLSQKCDLIIVVGEKTNDTNLLLEKCKNSINFNNIKEFLNYLLSNDLPDNIGITGGINVPLKEIYNYKYLLTFIVFYKKRLSELDANQNKINFNLIKNDDNEIVKDVVEDFIDLNKDGKYIRATLISLGEYLSNKDNNNYLNLAFAYEMFQTAVLIHDDIIDNARLRRGKMTIPRRICDKYLNRINNKDYQLDTLKYANSIGICAGDLGFYEANKLIIESYKNHEYLSKILEIYNNIVINTIKGEIIDVTLPFVNKYNYYQSEEKDILDIDYLKTSYYTLIGPFMLGYALNGKDIDDKLFNVLNKIGLSFQIKDDLLGIFSEEDNIGKSNISDIEEFKQTLLYSHIITTPYKEEFLKIYGKKNITDKELERIRELLILSESYDYVEDYLDNLSSDIISDIDSLDISKEGKDIFKGLLTFINIREK